MRKNQKGFTIVELLIAVAILSIVVASVCGFIIVGSRSYAAGNSDISVQQEAQLALNQMSDVLIDTTRSVNYAAYDAAGAPHTALKDAEFAFTPEDKSLIMLNGVVVKDPSSGADTMKEGNGNKHYHFYWKKASETLFYAEQDVNSGRVDTQDIIDNFPDPAFADPDADPESTHWYVLAQHVTDFSVDLSQVEEKRVVQLALTFVDGTKEYVTSNNVTIRNKVGVNDAELAPLNRKVEVDVVVKPSVVLEPGETFVLPTPNVTGKNVTDKTVTWSFLDSPDDASLRPDDKSDETTLTTDGILTLSIYVQGSFKVKATANAENADGSHSSAEITVNVKRVKDITLWKSNDSDPGNGPNEISPGCTFTVSGTVIGDFLDQTCDACGDDTSIDRHILSTKSPILGTDDHVWRVWDPYVHESADYIQKNPNLEGWHPSQHVINVDQNEFSATFTVTSDTSDAGDHGYVIQVMSLLSYYRPYGSPTYKGRRYDWVWPSISFTVVKSKSNINVNPGFKWGAVSNIDIGPDYPDGFNKSGQGYYLICARVREVGSKNERIMIYGTTGNNPLVTPDLFGLEDVSKTWEVSLQVIDPGQHYAGGVNPGPDVTLPSNPDSISDPTVRNAVKDYLANCDASGTYNGSLPHTGKFVGTLKPPVIYYEYDKKTNISGEVQLNKVNTLVGPRETSFLVDHVENTRGDRDGVSAFTNNHMKFSVYKEKDGGTEPIYWYDKDKKNYEGSSGPYNGTLQFINFSEGSRQPKINLELNNKSYFAEAAGRYRIVPSITYTQMADADTSYKVYYASYQPRYGVEQCYEVPESTVYYELQNGGNVEAFWSYNNGFTKGEIYFPTPSESSFTEYFDRENSNWQNAKKHGYFTKTIVGSTNTTEYNPQPSWMRCCYVPDSKVYELELFYDYWDSTWNRLGVVSAGVFQCAADGSRWERKYIGTFDSQLESGNRNPQLGPTTPTVEFKIGDKQYKGKLYIPLPSENAFSGKGENDLGFGKSEYPNFKVKENVTLIYQPEGSQNTEAVTFPKVKCTYNTKTDMYGLILTYSNANDDVIEGFKIKSDGEQWTPSWRPWNEPK